MIEIIYKYSCHFLELGLVLKVKSSPTAAQKELSGHKTGPMPLVKLSVLAWPLYNNPSVTQHQPSRPSNRMLGRAG